MNFETRDGKERLPDEEDIYGVNDAEERDAFNALFGHASLEERVRRRKARMRLIAWLTILCFALVFALAGIHRILNW